MPSRIAVIVNAAAGAGYTKEWADSLVGKFRTGGIEADVTLARSGDEIVEAARHAVNEKPQAVVAGGGDGTVNAVASALLKTDIAFGVLPLGTLNHFAKDLGIPLELDEAVRNIVAGRVIKVDVGEVNERIFLNNSSLGLYPDIVRDRQRQQRRLGRGKWLAFVWAAMAALRRYPFLHVRLSLNGEEHERRTPFIFVGNNEYLMQGFNIGSRTSLSDGQLSLYVAQRTGRLGLLRLAISALFGRLKQAKDFDVLSATRIVVETRHKRMRVATDGEVTVMATPLHYRIRARTLRVVVPQNSDTSSL
jgi:YegS/Rv2252/BmrU family lipid kinase